MLPPVTRVNGSGSPRIAIIGAGFSGISANFYPWLHARLCSAGATEGDKAKIQRFLSVAEVHAREHTRFAPAHA